VRECTGGAVGFGKNDYHEHQVEININSRSSSSFPYTFTWIAVLKESLTAGWTLEVKKETERRVTDERK